MATIVGNIGHVADNILKTKRKKYITNLEQDTTLDTFAVLTRLLIDISEQIWDCLNERDYLTATQLFQFSLFVKKNLDDIMKNGLKKATPFLDRVWLNHSHFQTTISEKVRLEISNQIPPEKAACCFISLSILEESNVHLLVKEFIVLRSNMLQHILSDNSSADRNIESSANLIINTIYNLFMCFTNYNQDHSNNGIIFFKIDKIFKSGPSVLSLVNLDYSLKFGIHFLPKSVKEFRVDCSLIANELSKDYITNIVINWLEWAKPFVCTKVTGILNSVQSLATLRHLNKLSTEYPQHWAAITEEIPCKLDLWSELYCPLFSQRTKELLTTQWEHVFPTIISDINNALTQPEESPLRENLFSDTNEFLETRSIGCSDKTAELCTCLEQRISSLAKTLDEYYPEDEDPWALRHHQGHCCNGFVNKLTEHMVELVEKGTLSEAQILLIARFLWNFPVLCPTFKHCLISLYQQFNFWKSTKDSIQKSSIVAWNRWSDIVTNRIFESFQKRFLPHTLGEMLSTIPKWEIVDMEVEKESGELIISKLHVPNQPSFPLQEFIHTIITCLAVTLPPRFVQERTITLSTDWILSAYKSNSEIDVILKSRYQIQKLFDLKYINTLFIGVENKNLSAKCSEIILLIENHIDPINLDVINEYVVKNVKRAVAATKCIFGTSLPSQLSLEFSDEANNLMFNTYRFKLFLVTDS
ncbi:uncharacterized protein LOC126846140 isoform X2 [Adelges cooleyi]|nr:uncharacterized protein LOC126846140 isoform X2 [Adelges cooleyi]